MSGKPNDKVAKTIKERYGDDYFKIIGAKGGKKTGIKGFAAMSPERRRELGKKGGSVTGDRYKTRSYA